MNNLPVTPAENASVPAPVPTEASAPVTETVTAPVASPAPTPEQPKKKRKLWLIPVCIVGALLVIAGALYAVYSVTVTGADRKFAAGNYSGARDTYEMLSFLPGYDEKVKECDYRIAKLTLEAGNHRVARDQFLALGSYSDSREMADECLYLLAGKYFDTGDYTTASEVYAELGDYKDSAELAYESIYVGACELEKDREYQDAIDAFELIVNYKDSNSRRLRCAMNLASELYRSDRFEECAQLAEEYADQHPHAGLYRILAELGHLRDEAVEMERLQAIMDIIAKYTNENPDAKEAMEDPQFFVLRFFGAEWEADNGDTLDADLEKLTIFYDVSWHTPDGDPWYVCDENHLYFFTDKNDDFWFAVTGFDSYDTPHPAEMYVTDNEDNEYVFHNTAPEAAEN